METNDSELPGVVGGGAVSIGDRLHLPSCFSLSVSASLSFSGFSCNGNTSKENDGTLQNDCSAFTRRTQMFAFEQMGQKHVQNPTVKKSRTGMASDTWFRTREAEHIPRPQQS